MRRPHRFTLLIAIVLGTVLSACGANSGLPAVGEQLDEGADAAPAASAPLSGTAGGDGGGRDLSGGGNAAPIEQRIIKTGQVSLEVDNVAAVMGEVRSVTDALGGYVGGSQAGTLEESATLTLRVPADRFEELLARLHELEDVDVVSESTSERDVTREIVDLDARIRNLEASEASYRVLLDRAERIEDILTVQARLDEVRGQIEQLRGQLETVEGQADLSTLTVTLIPRGEPVEAVQATWDPGGELDGALATLVGLGQGAADALIWLAVVWVPLLLMLGLIGLVVFRVATEVRRRWPVDATSREGGPMR